MRKSAKCTRGVGGRNNLKTKCSRERRGRRTHKNWFSNGALPLDQVRGGERSDHIGRTGQDEGCRHPDDR